MTKAAKVLEKITTEWDHPVTHGDLFDVQTVDVFQKYLQNNIKAPWMLVQISTLGGKDNPAVILKLSLQPKAEWPNKIFHNSDTGMMFDISKTGVIEQFYRARSQKNFRKAIAKTQADVVKKINDYLAKIKQ